MVVEARAWQSVGQPSKSIAPNGAIKTKAELAKEANVGTRSIDRAKEVSRAFHVWDYSLGFLAQDFSASASGCTS